MNDFLREIEQAESIVILGHIRPDGDCVGSCLGVYNYVLDNYPEKSVDIYLDTFKPEFMFLRGADRILHEKQDKSYDLCISLDSGDLDRHAENVTYTLLEVDKIGQECAEALYVGIVHDTGVFKFSNTTKQTMEIAGILIEKGARSQLVIDGTFYKKTFFWFK